MFSACFIMPSWHHYANPFLHQPYWELYYATILREQYSKNILVEAVDLRGFIDADLDKKVETIKEYDLYCYWMFKSTDAIENYNTAKKLKIKYPKSIHVAGGTHVEMMPEESANFFDAIIIGPGEYSFKKVVDDIQQNNLQKIYQQEWKEVPFRDTPFPRRDFLPRDHVVNNNLFNAYGGALSTMVYFSRGCHYRCGFCTLNVPGELQIRSPEMVKSEIKYLKENYNVQAILLKDEIAIHPNEKHSTPLLEAIGESDIIWRGQGTSQVSYDQLKLAYDSGCKEMAVGVETVDGNVMKIINKGWQTEKQILEFVSNAKKIGIKIKMCLIFGLPGEKDNIAEKTIEFIEKNDIDYVNVSGFAPMPGSPIFKDLKRYGIKYVDHDWSKHAHLLYRFSNDESVGLPFEYEKENKWGATLARDQIIDNIRKVQRWLQSNNRSY